MIMTEKLLPCICGAAPEKYMVRRAGWIYCPAKCINEITGETMKDAIIMWNGAMKALKETPQSSPEPEWKRTRRMRS